MTDTYWATWRGRRVFVLCVWQHIRGATPSAVVEYGDPVDGGDGEYRHRAVVPLSELERCEDASKTG